MAFQEKKEPLKSYNNYLLSYRQSENKIHTYIFPRSPRNKQRCIQSNILTTFFSYLTYFATLHHFLNILLYMWPKVYHCNLLHYLINPKMPCKSNIRFLLNDIILHRSTWYTKLNSLNQNIFLNEIINPLLFLIFHMILTKFPRFCKIKVNLIQVLQIFKYKHFDPISFNKIILLLHASSTLFDYLFLCFNTKQNFSMYSTHFICI